MRQFDVYKNPSKKTSKLFPYLVDIQHSHIEQISSRIVVPLGRAEYFKNNAMTRLTPEIDFEDEELILLVPQLASVDKNILKNPIGSLEHIRDDIIGSLDFAVTGT